MNERIDELAFEAGCHRHKFWDPKHLDLEGFIISQAVLDKFAELIVRECLVQIGEAIPDTNCSAADAYKTAKLAATSRVKEHFGVE